MPYTHREISEDLYMVTDSKGQVIMNHLNKPVPPLSAQVAGIPCDDLNEIAGRKHRLKESLVYFMKDDDVLLDAHYIFHHFVNPDNLYRDMHEYHSYLQKTEGFWGDEDGCFEKIMIITEMLLIDNERVILEHKIILI